MTNEQNGWNEWSRHVLKELERLNASYQSISTEVAEIKAKVVNYDPAKLTKLEIQVSSLQSSDADQEARLRDIEQKAAIASTNIDKITTLEKALAEAEKREAKMSGKWAVLALIGAAVVSAAVGLMFKAFSPTPPTPTELKKQSNAAIEQVLTHDELASLRQGR